jgi:hypothetical protein
MKEVHLEHPLLASEGEITVTRNDLTRRLARWRNLQEFHMPKVRELVLSQDPSPLEEEQLFLPSHFSEQERNTFSLTALAMEESQLREGELLECIMQLRRAMKTLSIIHAQRQKNDRSQRSAQRSHTQRQTVELTRDRLLHIYNDSRTALLTLSKAGKSIEERYPALSLKDLYRKSTVEKRQLGVTNHLDGQLWHLRKRKASIPATSEGSLLPHPETTTANSGLSISEIREDNEVAQEPQIDVGMLWSPVIGLSKSEMEKWDREGKCHIKL